jgi:hypothetical protein
LRKRDDTTLTYTFDALSQLILKTVPERPAPHPYPLTPAQTRDVHYGYDLRNAQLYARFDSPTGEGVTNSYDAFGRLKACGDSYVTVTDPRVTISPPQSRRKAKRVAGPVSAPGGGRCRGAGKAATRVRLPPPGSA